MTEPHRYKGAWGGRAAAKSHFFATWTIVRAYQQKTDIVCIREVQLSIKYSVKRLLEQKIQAMGLGPAFRVLDDRIESANGGIIIFQGMSLSTAESIKSLEDYDVAWVEEAQSLSQRSLDILRPTLRKPGSELWFSWNPNLATDPVDALLRGEHPPPDTVLVKSTYRENPWLSDESLREAEYDRERDPERFAHIWLGEYQRHSEARVFKNWRVEEFERPAGTIYRFGADWGYAVDPSVLVRMSIDGNRIYVDHEAYMVGCEITQLPDLFGRIPEANRWFITADSARPETISHLRRNGFPKINAAIKGPRSLEEGVAFLQSYDLIVHPRCQHVIDELTLYRYKSDPLTGKVLPLLEDKHNHCIAEGALVTCRRGEVPIEQVTTDDFVLTRCGWRRVLFSGQTDAERETVLVQTMRGTLRCTPDHRIATARGFVRADALRYDDEIVNVERLQWSSASNGMAGHTGAIRTRLASLTGFISGAVSAAVRHYCTAMYGSFTTGLSGMVSRFITSTAIPATMTSAIYACSRTQSIRRGTRGMMSAEQSKVRCLNVSGRLVRHGIAAQMGEPSTSKSALSLMRNSSPSESGAVSVGNGSCRGRSATSIVIAPTPASQQRGALGALMTRLGFAWYAVRNFAAIATVRCRPVPGHVVTVSDGGRCARVYDLTVDGQHEFFADGVLVSNCIDALRYACEGVRHAKSEKMAPIRYINAGIV